MSQHVIVVGAGIIGASIGYHLAQAGAKVTILEKGEPAQGTTANSFAWINASRGKTPAHYFQLNLLGMQAWREIDEALDGRLQIRWGGSVEWHPDSAEFEAIQIATDVHRGFGYELEEISAETLTQLEPNILIGGAESAIYSPTEGHADPVILTTVLLEEAQKLGAELRTQCEVVEIFRPKGHFHAVQTTLGRIEADTLVIASGNWSTALAAMADIDVPLIDSPGVLVHTTPQPDLIERVVLSPHGHMKQEPDGHLVVGMSFSGSDGSDNSLAAGQKQLDHSSQSLPHLSNMPIDKVTLGWRVMPVDELPIISFADDARDIYICTMHSGITLGILVGQLATLEILGGDTIDLLQPYRLARFALLEE